MKEQKQQLFDQVERAIESLTLRLKELQTHDGHWTGELASSALSTATAVSALSIVRDGSIDHQTQRRLSTNNRTDRFDSLIERGCQYITGQQNPDGGWGDTDRSKSNISTTLLCIAALHLANRDQQCREQIEAAWKYVDACGRWDGLKKRYGKDKTFAVPILTNCALAGLVPWKLVSPLPFEAAALPQSMYRLIRLPVVSYAIPALVAIGQVREHFLPVKNPLRWPIRQLAIEPSLNVLRKMQPKSGGYLEAIPLTSFVLMSLAAKGLVDHPVSQDAIGFIESSVRPDGSWPIDSNLATWVTSLTTAACLRANQDEQPITSAQYLVSGETIEWLLSCQHRQRHPFTGADPGGWGWSDLSGAVPDADDTPAALIALHRWYVGNTNQVLKSQIEDAVELGIRWLLGLQNSDGGWPTFCRGWGALPFDRSGSDLTAHAMRALHVWQPHIHVQQIPNAISRGWRYLQKHQRSDGSWLPLWFGNQDEADDINPIYGTARVLKALLDCGYQQTEVTLRAIEFLQKSQNADGGWGGGPAVQYSGSSGGSSTIEETAQALEVLAGVISCDSPEIVRGLRWLTEAIENKHFDEPQPIGFYFAKLWYYEQMYPMAYSLAAFKVVRSAMMK